MLSVILLFLVGVRYGAGTELGETYSSSSGHFFENVDHSLNPNETWHAVIQPPNATRIFIVIEKMILDGDDNVTAIIENGTTFKLGNGSHDPFSFITDAVNLTIAVTTSSSKSIRKFAGYYTDSGCIYQMNDTSGILSTPMKWHNQSAINCSFSFAPELRALSKLSVAFLNFQLKKSKLEVIVNGIHYSNYSGESVPPEIITDENLELNFALNGNDTAEFRYGNVLKESEYVELNSASQSHKFTYTPSPIMSYSAGEECHWVIKSEENTTISLKFAEILLPSEATHIIIHDGKDKFSTLLLLVSTSNTGNIKNRYISSSGNFLWISLVQPDKHTLALIEAKMHVYGGYRKGDGKLSVPVNSAEVVYLLEEENGNNVILDQHKGSLTSNSTLYVYDSFYTDSEPIMTYNTSLPHYPIASSTSQMMIIAKGFTANTNYEAEYKKIKEGCYKMSHSESGEYFLFGNCNTSCKWIVPPHEDVNQVISLHIHPLTFEEQDAVTLSLLDGTDTLIANITSHTNMLPEFYLPSSSGFLLNGIKRNCSVSHDMLHATFEKIPGCNMIHKLQFGKNVSVSSPNFPDRYPLRAHCWTNFTTVNGTESGHYLVTFNEIGLAASHCLKIRDNATVKTYEGMHAILPGDLILSGNASIEFSALPCNSTKKQPLNLTTSSGFSLDILSSDCGGKIEKTEGNFSTPDFPKNTSAIFCTWILELPGKKDIINFTLTKNDSKDFEFAIYDGPSIHNETMKNHSASETLLSRTNSLVFIYHNQNSLTAPGIRVVFHSQACSTKCQNGLCLHDDWKCNGVNDCGDNTDEIDCQEVPVVTTTTSAPPPPDSYGVSPVALGLGIPIAFILGILATIYLPPLIRRFRSGQYHQFRDVSADA